ncbi:hypothetical protein GCM10007103_14160 [Salinimicrobium marinum]|uniref:DUF2490 domain-containing protein n=1 Tax=Salinimicrobium marinum TaxID=680283 RepID=A0A918SC68_9FLAO|nr:hypothetical protein GCM10007103_14160 [Salinimicrobium marinum]
MVNCNLAFSQNSKSYYYENEFDLSLPVGEKWSMEIGVGNRGMSQETLEGEKLSGYQHDHLEINQFTKYESSESLVLSLGLRYRFKELFDSSESNEFRVIEQLEFEPVNAVVPLSHRLRLEQRFKEHTIHRMRYEMEFSRPLNDTFEVGVATEALYAVSSREKPEAEQRFSIAVENTSFRNLELEIEFEYRMEDYARDLGHEFFIVTGVSLEL